MAQAHSQQRVSDEHGKFKFETLTAGSWTFSIELKDAYISVPPFEDTVTINLKNGATKCSVIRFKLYQPVPVVITKIDQDHRPLEGWEMKASPAQGFWFAYPVTGTTDVNGQTTLVLREGNWVFTEKPPKPEDTENGTPVQYRPVSPVSGSQNLDFECKLVNQGGTTVCETIFLRFKNLIDNACIDAYKYDYWDGQGPKNTPLAGWKITLKTMGGTVITSGYTDTLGHVKFDHLMPGPYIVMEEVQSGWDVRNSTQTSYVVSVVRGPKCAQVQFQNVQKDVFCIEGRKIDYFGNVGIPNWEITAVPQTKGGYPDPGIPDINPATSQPFTQTKLIAYTNGEGVYRFDFPEDDYRIPGSKYQVCEKELDGWLTHTPLCQTVTVPSKPGACVKPWDFVNQQVGHWESITQGGGSSSGGSCMYVTVQPGQSLCGIGNAYGVSCGTMFAYNPWVYNQPNNYLYTGQSVCVPQ